MKLCYQQLNLRGLEFRKRGREKKGEEEGGGKREKRKEEREKRGGKEKGRGREGRKEKREKKGGGGGGEKCKREGMKKFGWVVGGRGRVALLSGHRSRIYEPM